MNNSVQTKRLISQAGFFILFVLAPPLDLFRLDLTLGHFIIFGQDWTLGLDQFAAGQISAGQAALNIFLRAFLPIGSVIAFVLWISWKYGRLYCGWLCPHFSVVETVNAVMRRAIGKFSLWDKEKLPQRNPDGSVITPDRRYWLLLLPLVFAFALLWAVTLLTYLLPPQEIYHNLWNGVLTRNQAFFIGFGTLAFFVEFTLARHLFCRFGCAVGLFQSLAWMANKKALVVGFNRAKAGFCYGCNIACDNVCPMRLNPRTIKRHMFSCTECGQCIAACEQVQINNPDGSLLKWVEDDCALSKSDRNFGHRPVVPAHCFEPDNNTILIPIVWKNT